MSYRALVVTRCAITVHDLTQKASNPNAASPWWVEVQAPTKGLSALRR